MKIVIGSDHAGFELKKRIKKILTDQGKEVLDLGCEGPESVDYPDFGQLVAKKVSAHPEWSGILICGTGIGMSIVANKFHGVRAALVQNEFEAQMSREHNDANVLVLGAKIVKEDEVSKILAKWVETPFDGGRHQKRIDKIKKIEEE